MALTYGFYNSIEGDRVYDAIQFGRIFDGIIKDGVYATYEKGMMVIASENPSEVIIQPGRAWFNHTWSYNDANVIFEAPAPEVLLERYDALVLEINEELSSRENSFKWVTGTPSSRPERPTLINTSTIHQYPLCYVHRYPETTMIYTRDITNAIGTSECPFATGVLEGIDLDAWINQWDDEFHNWENSKKTQFEAWMLSQETAFTTWYNAFKDQMASDVQEVEDFVDYLESVLDASTAVHLQEEIDDLRNEISSGSHITVTTINPELYGRNVTITESGGTVFTEKFDNTGVAVFKSVPYVGNLTISSTYGTQTAERVVNTPYYARYEFAIAFWAATVNIVGDPEMSGSTVTIKDSNETVVGTVVLDSEGTGVYTAIKPDTYKFTLTYGGETMEVTLSVTQETTYTVDLHAAGFKWQDWLEAGGVTGSYSSLDDVLADEVALRRLFSVHASVDYMAGINKENEDVEKIIGTDLAAKWINLRDYALDTLYANEIIAGYMDTADKYFYGEWTLQPQVPTMTSSTAPYGEVISSPNYNFGGEVFYAYYAFDGNDSTRFVSKRSDNTGQVTIEDFYLAYKFPNALCAKKATMKFVIWRNVSSVSDASFDVVVKGSNDNGATWVTLSNPITCENPNLPLKDYTLTTVNFNLNSNDSYSAYGIFIVNSNEPLVHSTNEYSFEVASLQFYTWQPKGNVPVMTSNTAPYGEASASSVSSGYDAWRAFMQEDDGEYDRWVSVNNVTNAYIQYKFVNPTCVKKVSFKSRALSRKAGDTALATTAIIQGSNDGFVNDTNNLAIISITVEDADNVVDYDVSTNDSYYLYYRIQFNGPNVHYQQYDYCGLALLQFYGRELSVSVPEMTSNTTPYGTVRSTGNGETNGTYINHNNVGPTNQWVFFQRTYTDRSSARTCANCRPNGYIEYEFVSPVVMRAFTAQNNFDGNLWWNNSFEIMASNDGTNFTSLGTFERASGANYQNVWYFDNDTPYKYYRYYNREGGTGHNTSNAPGSWANFFGVDYSEKEFEEGTTKKWLYDHGVELEEMQTLRGVVIKGNNSIRTDGENSANATASVGMSIDLTPYDLIRMKVDFFKIVNSNALIVVNNTTAWSVLGNVVVSSSNAPNNIALDISSVDQTAVIDIQSYAGNGTGGGIGIMDTTELWLE